jgi:hypothetical protein
MSKRLADMHLSELQDFRGSETSGFRGSYYLMPYFSRTPNWRTLARYIFRASGLRYFGASDFETSGFKVPPTPHIVPSNVKLEIPGEALWSFTLQGFLHQYTHIPPNVEFLNSRVALWHFITLALPYFGLQKVLQHHTHIPSERRIGELPEVSSTIMHQGGATWKKYRDDTWPNLTGDTCQVLTGTKGL